MGQIPVQTKLAVEDVPDQNRSWMSKIIQPINQFISSTIAVLDKDVSFTENIRCQIKQLTFTNNTASFPLTFKCSLKTKPFGVIKTRLLDTTDSNSTPSSAAEILSWDYTQDGSISISGISSLTADHKYQITLLVI